MSRRTAITAACAIAVTIAASLAQAQQTRTPAHAPAGRAGLGGLWETETAAALLAGELSASPLGVEAEMVKRVKLWGKPPYNAEWQQKSQRAAASASPPDSSRLRTSCEMADFPEVMEVPGDGMFELLVTPGETLLLTLYGTARHIYTDGRGHPPTEDFWPTSMGDSIGHWQGAILLIDTIARKAGPVTPIPLPGIADLSGRARFTEALRLLDANTLQDDLTIDDPKRFTHPWQISIRYRRVTDVDRMIPIDCSEHERNVMVNGHATIAPP